VKEERGGEKSYIVGNTFHSMTSHTGIGGKGRRKRGKGCIPSFPPPGKGGRERKEKKGKIFSGSGRFRPHFESWGKRGGERPPTRRCRIAALLKRGKEQGLRRAPAFLSKWPGETAWEEGGGKGGKGSRRCPGTRLITAGREAGRKREKEKAAKLSLSFVRRATGKKSGEEKRGGGKRGKKKKKGAVPMPGGNATGVGRRAVGVPGKNGPNRKGGRGGGERKEVPRVGQPLLLIRR